MASGRRCRSPRWQVSLRARSRSPGGVRSPVFVLRCGPRCGTKSVHPILERSPDLVRRILLDIVNALHAHLTLIRPGPAELARTAGEQRSGFGCDEEFRHRALFEPRTVALYRRDDIR